jgi:hypothetical protein
MTLRYIHRHLQNLRAEYENQMRGRAGRRFSDEEAFLSLLGSLIVGLANRMRPQQERLDEISREFGCSDGGCVFGHPGGMHTNGGCHCARPNATTIEAAQVRAGIRALREELE